MQFDGQKETGFFKPETDIFLKDNLIGTYKEEDGAPYRYLGHLSWIYYDNDETDDDDIEVTF